MGLFKGNAYSADTQNHAYMFNASPINDLGIYTITRNDFAKIQYLSPPSHPFNQIQPTVDGGAVNPLDYLATKDGEYRHFDGSKYIDKKITKIKLESVISYHETGDGQNEEFNTLIKEIQNSLGKRVVFKDAATGHAISVYIYDIGSRKNDRIVTQKGLPIITTVPRRVTGGTYSHRWTADKVATKIATHYNVGSYVKATSEMDNDLNNVVTAPIKLSYNQTIGMFESANQVLARLITEVEAAQVIGLDLPEDKLDNGYTNSDFYDIGGSLYMGQFTTGLAIPLSIEGANPHMFGPNIIEQGGQKIIERIRVVNRSARSFKKGAIVICSHIDGEWIVQDFGSSDITVTPQPTTVGRWGFAKFIANSDWFFRNATDGSSMLPLECQDMLKAKFFNSDIFRTATDPSRLALARLNTTGAAIKNLYPYLQCSIADNTSTTKGGNNTETLYSKINYQEAYSDDNYPTYYQLPLFWGPVFPDGYLTNGYKRVLTNNKNLKPESFFFTSNIPVKNLAIGHNEKFIELPAEFATNGKYDGDGFPLEDYWEVIRTINTSNFAVNINNYLGLYAYWLKDIDGADALALRPANPLRVQFSSLTAELAGADDANSYNLLNQFTLLSADRKFAENAREFINKPNFTGKFFGELYKRNPKETLLKRVKCYAYSTDAGGDFNGIPYDCYIQTAPLNSPRATTGAFYNPNDATGSNTVGIITARNKFSKTGGGALTISAQQMFGLVGQFIGNGSNPVNITILPIGGGIGWSTDTGPSMKARYLPVWGSTINDSINSFGTTALHIMVWDAWPDKLTAFVPQYFSVLHFNDGQLFAAPTTKTVKIKNADNVEKDVIVDNIDFTDLDFREPTQQTEAGGNIVLSRLAPGTVVTSTMILADSSYWKVNTSRRGQLVTNGFYYYMRKIGLNIASAKTLDAGTGFKVGDVINGPKNTVFKVTAISTATGGIVSVAFDTKEMNGVTYEQRGTNFLPSDFAGKDGFVLTLRNETPDSKPAVLGFTSGICYEIIEFQEGPRQRTPITRLTTNSGTGTVRVDTTKETIVNVESNVKSKYPGQYESFFFFHNDIGHVYNADFANGTNPNYVQHVTISIS